MFGRHFGQNNDEDGMMMMPPEVLSDNKCAAEMGVMPLLRLLPMIVIAPFCSRSQRYKLAFLCLSLYFYKQSQNSVFFSCCQSISSFGQNYEFLFETLCFSDRAEKFIWANKSQLGVHLQFVLLHYQ